MKRSLQIFNILLVFYLTAHGIMGQNRIGIGTTTPAFLLDVQGDPASTSLTIINSKANYSGELDIKAFDGHSVPMDGRGIGGEFTGGFRGINAHGLGGASAGTVIGVHASATGTAGTRYGIYGTASGGMANVGVVGSVSGGTGNVGVYGLNANPEGYAGYFLGRGHFTDQLRAAADLIVDNTLWTNTIWDQNGGVFINSTTDIQLTIDRNNSGIFGFFEIFNGQGEHVFAAGETGNTYSF